jgi:probable HAF family extracellular repeat protein
MQDLGTIPGGTGGSIANGVSGNLVVGSSSTSSSANRAFVYDLSDPEAVMQDLGTLGGENGIATGVSGNVVVGYSHVSGYTGLHATVWTPDNSPPTGTVQIDPDAVTAGTYTFTATPSFIDPDGDPLTYEYVWTMNGQGVGANSDTLSDIAVFRGDVIAVGVIASDGTAFSTPATDQVVVSNSAPSGSVQITPDTVTAGTYTFTATPSVSDLDQDPLTYHYAWTKNDIPVGGDSATLARQKVVKGDSIGVTVTVSDGIESSSVTDDVTVGNTPPSAGTVKISPARVSPGTYTFTATPARFTDKDGDALTYHYVWTQNGEYMGESNTVMLTVAQNDVVAVSVTADDGTDLSPAATAEVTVKASRK